MGIPKQMTCYEVRVYGGQCEVSSTMIKSEDIIMESVYIRSPWHKRGALEGEYPGRMSILRNGNVICLCPGLLIHLPTGQVPLQFDLPECKIYLPKT